METEKSPGFFPQKYPDLHKTPEVNRSLARSRRAGEKIPGDKTAIIDAHFERIDVALEKHPNLFRGLFNRGEREKLINSYTLNLQNEDGSENEERVAQLAQGLFESEKEILTRRGMGEELEQYGDKPTPEDFEKYRQQIYDKKQEQEKSLAKWADYLSSEQADFYPTWFKYLVIRSLSKMGRRDRDTESYSKRSANSIQPFPDLSYEALAQTLTALKNQSEIGTTVEVGKQVDLSDEELTALAEIDRLADKGDFAKLYAHFQGEKERSRRELGRSTAGEWIHYAKGSDAKALSDTLAGKGTEWCTAGLDVARGQLNAGEFWVYYTYDQNNQPTDPRVAIYLINGEISEVRGVYGNDQDIELEFVDIAKEKYKDFPGSGKYEKKERDMKELTKIENKFDKDTGVWQEKLGREELVFLYEIDSKIVGFGQGDDPRVAQLRNTRNHSEDAPVVFGCQPEEIAWGQNEINQNTKAYIGEWSVEIFQKVKNYPNIEHLYESFPEKKILLQTLNTSETKPAINSQQTTEEGLRQKNIYLTDWGKDVLAKTEFSQESQTYNLVRFTVGQLGFSNGATTDEIYKRAEELGLGLCPAEVGPHLRLQNDTLEWTLIAMKQITARSGLPRVFDLDWLGRLLGLDGHDADPDYGWDASYGFVFCFRKLES